MASKEATARIKINKLIADIMFPGKYQSDFAVQVTSQIPDAQQFTKDGVLQPQKSAFKLFDFFANSEYFEEDYHIIEEKQFTDLATNPVFSTRDFKAVPPKYRTLIPEYIKDYVSLNQFAA